MASIKELHDERQALGRPLEEEHKLNRFKKGSGCFTCLECGKRTRRTVDSNIGDEFCRACIDAGEHENAHNDNAKDWNCGNPDCKLNPRENKMNRELVVTLRVKYSALMQGIDCPDAFVSDAEMKLLNEFASSINKIVPCRVITMCIEDEKNVLAHKEWDKSGKMGAKCSWSYEVSE